MRRWIPMIMLGVSAACADTPPLDPPGGTPPPGGTQPQNPPTPSLPSPTPVGEPTGAAVASAVVGPEGGALASADGRLLVTVPAGALSAATTLSIQPIENHAHGGAGIGYRLAPHGVTFAQPVRLGFRYTEDDVAGSAPGLLRVAFQDSTRRWRMFREPEVDSVARTVSVRTTHFSDWSLVPGARLFPVRATTKPGGTVPLAVKDCLPPPKTPSLLEPLAYECRDGFYSTTTGNWYVNGVVGGTTGTGTVVPNHAQGGATYRAPAKVNGTMVVAASVEYFGTLSKERGLLVSPITIAGCTDASAIEAWDGAFSLEYSFSAQKARVGHAADMVVRLERARGDSTHVVWHGKLRGSVSVSDDMYAGDMTITHRGGGPPLVLEPDDHGADVNAYLEVDLKRCSYRFWLNPAIRVTTTIPTDPPHVTETLLGVGIVAAGERPVSGLTLAGQAEFPGQNFRPDGDTDAYLPIGGTGVLVGAGGTASVGWSIVAVEK